LFAAFQQPFDIPRAVKEGDDGDWLARRVVHDEVGVNAPELHRPRGQVLSLVTDFRRGSELVERMLQGFQDVNRGVDAVLGNERADVVEIRLRLGVRR
jgi:hypothetical protein